MPPVPCPPRPSPPLSAVVEKKAEAKKPLRPRLAEPRRPWATRSNLFLSALLSPRLFFTRKGCAFLSPREGEEHVKTTEECRNTKRKEIERRNARSKKVRLRDECTVEPYTLFASDASHFPTIHYKELSTVRPVTSQFCLF